MADVVVAAAFLLAVAVALQYDVLAALAAGKDPVAAWQSIVDNPESRRAYQRQRGKGGFVRASWEEAAEMIAASLVVTFCIGIGRQTTTG